MRLRREPSTTRGAHAHTGHWRLDKLRAPPAACVRVACARSRHARRVSSHESSRARVEREILGGTLLDEHRFILSSFTIQSLLVVHFFGFFLGL